MNSPSAAVAFAVGAGVTLAVTPLAIGAAGRWGFLDRPGGHKHHVAPTPYLGGLAVLTGTAAATAVSARQLDGEFRLTGPLTVTCGGAAAMCILGTLDDRSPVAWQLRLGTAAAAGLALSVSGGGLHTCGSAVVDASLTCVWIAGLTTAFNLMDNLDGACASVATTSALCVSATALVNHEPTVAAMAGGLSGACLAFLRANLALPRAKIFLGDGGSMPVGLLIGALAVQATAKGPGGASPLLAAALLCGLPILDTTLVSISRPRRGISLFQGGQDHLSHRILRVARTPRRTAWVLAGTQALSAGCAVAGEVVGAKALVRLACAGVLVGAVVIAGLEALLPVTETT